MLLLVTRIVAVCISHFKRAETMHTAALKSNEKMGGESPFAFDSRIVLMLLYLHVL